MEKILVKCTGFIGDILFASSIARKLKEQTNNITIDYSIPVAQPLELLFNNPYIDNVLLDSNVTESNYDRVIVTPVVDQSITPPRQFQQSAGIKDLDDKFKVYTNTSYDYLAEQTFSDAKNKGVKVITWLSNWEERSYLYTEQQYKDGIDVPNLGYGGSHRDINYIISNLNSNYAMLEVGFTNGVNQFSTGLNTAATYSFTASLIKASDYFIGAEGGLANLAAGVGTKTIITGDFVHQLYGWNGVIKKIKEPKLGPKFYFGENNHTTLDPYLTDSEVVEKIKELV
tara:strand:- start:298 stop:1152 length:855 start_codon:yes stop_codon:yes gene_type:complete